jgi:ABC-2 type transport system ATP-binding protein
MPEALSHTRPDIAPSGDEFALVAKDLVKTYRTGRGTEPVRALDGLGLAVRPGEVFALLGPNGAGKSTTVKILATLSRPESGTASVAGHPIDSDASGVRRSIGLVSQKPSSAPMATGRESVELAGRLQGLSRRQAHARADDLLDRFGLGGAADRLTKTYSGGMARKLDVAIGLVNRPRVLFLDEPTTGLDPEARAEMWAEIARMAAQEQMTVLLTTHYLDEADHLANRVAILDHGRVVIEGTPDALKSELQGDGLAIDLVDAQLAPAAADTVASLAGVTEVAVQGRTIRARAGNGARAVPAALMALEAQGVGVASATVTRPSLDDVYLRHVGRTFEGANR